MPRIPTYQPEAVNLGRIQPGTGAMALPNAPTPLYLDPRNFRSGAGLIAIGKAMGEMVEEGEIMARRQAKLKEQEELNYLSGAESDLKSKWVQYVADAQQRKGSDANGVARDAFVWMDEQAKPYLEGAPNDAVRQSLERKITDFTAVGRGQIASHEAKQRRVVNMGAIESNIQDGRKLVYLGLGDPKTVSADAVGTIGAYFKAGAIDAFSAKQKAREAMAEIYKAELNGLIDRDPAAAVTAFESGKYGAFLDQKQLDAMADRINQRKLELEQETIRAKRVAEKAGEKAKKEAIKEADFKAIQQYHDGKLTHGDLQRMADNRVISSKVFNTLATKLKKDAEGGADENNPMVVGPLAERIAFGDDVTEDLNDALQAGEIKSETYIGMRKTIADKAVSRSIGYVNDSLRPSPADRYDVGKYLRHANAVSEFYERTGAGEDPDEVSHDVVSRYLSNTRVRLMGLRAPKYLSGNRSDPAAIQQAKESTTQAFDNKVISPEAYRDEMNLLIEMEAILGELNQPETSLSEEDKKRIEQIQKLKR